MALVTFTEEILNRKLHFLSSGNMFINEKIRIREKQGTLGILAYFTQCIFFIKIVKICFCMFDYIDQNDQIKYHEFCKYIKIEIS